MLHLPAAVGRRRPQRRGLMGGDIRRWVAQGADERPAQYFLQGARDDRTVTYARLATLARALEVQLGRIGAPSDGPIAVSCDDCLDYAATFVALLAVGRTVVPLDPRAPASELRRTRALTGTVATVTRSGLFEAGAGPTGGFCSTCSRAAPGARRVRLELAGWVVRLSGGLE